MNRRRSFGAQRASVSASRQFVDEAVADLPSAVRESAVLMISELATNAVVHATTGFEVSVTRAESAVRVEVTDAGSGQPTLRSPSSRDPHGRGLQIVKELSDAWGTSEGPDHSGKTVWFEILVDPTPVTDGEDSRPRSRPKAQAGTPGLTTEAPALRSTEQAGRSEDGRSTLSAAPTGYRKRRRIKRRAVRIRRRLVTLARRP